MVMVVACGLQSLCWQGGVFGRSRSRGRGCCIDTFGYKPWSSSPAWCVVCGGFRDLL